MSEAEQKPTPLTWTPEREARIRSFYSGEGTSVNSCLVELDATREVFHLEAKAHQGERAAHAATREQLEEGQSAIRGLKRIIVEFQSDQDALKEQLAQAQSFIETLLESAVPHPVEHPTMTAAWKEAKQYLAALRAKQEPPQALRPAEVAAEDTTGLQGGKP